MSHGSKRLYCMSKHELFTMNYLPPNNITINIISYNKRKVEFGLVVIRIGFIILFIDIIPFVWQNFGMPLAFFALLILLIGSGITDHSEKKTTKIGSIVIEKDRTKINENSIESEILNKEYKAKFSKSGYKGLSNYIPFLNVGYFTTNSGINRICFFNDDKKYEYDIQVNSRSEFNKLKTVLSNNFMRE